MTPRRVSRLEQIVFNRLCAISEPQKEYRFHPIRKWRFDFAYPNSWVAVECEGGVWVQGRHNRGSGFIADCEKYNAATLMGWKVFRYTIDNVKDLDTDIRHALAISAIYREKRRV